MENAKQPSERIAQDRNEGLTAELALDSAETPVTGQQAAPLLSTDESNHLREAWDSIQAGFVDEPRHAVEQADNLVADTMRRLAEMFTAERSKLEGQWDRGGDVSTEIGRA